MTFYEGLLYGVFTLMCACCLATLAIGSRLRRHLRRCHPVIWRSCGFPSDSVVVAAKDEREHAQADRALSEFLRSERRRTLQDPTLDRLVTLGRYTSRTGVLAFVLSFVLFILVKS
jgi:hypothetical protein